MSMDSLKMMEYSNAKIHEIKICPKNAMNEEEAPKNGGAMKLERAGEPEEPLALVKRKQPALVGSVKSLHGSANSVQPLQAAHTMHGKRGVDRVESEQTLLKPMPKQGI